MENWRKIDKHRLTVFTDAIFAIIMTILVLDLKVPVEKIESDKDLLAHLWCQLPHFFGFALSFSVIVIIWFSHHDLMAHLSEADITFTALNFFFTGAIATIPFTTALVSEFPWSSFAVSLMAFNMFLMSFFLTTMFIYRGKKNMEIPDSNPLWYANIKGKMGVAGAFLLFAAVFVAYLSPKLGMAMVVLVPLMHCIPLREPNK